MDHQTYHEGRADVEDRDSSDHFDHLHPKVVGVHQIYHEGDDGVVDPYDGAVGVVGSHDHPC